MNDVHQTENFLSLYQEFCREITDAPEVYHEAVGLATVAVVLGNNVSFEFGDSQIFPNLWLNVLGDSSVTRKTTSINISKRLIPRQPRNVSFPMNSARRN